MKDYNKTKRQLIDELVVLRRQITELQEAEAERKRTGDALRESEEKYRSLVESTEDSIYVVDKEYRYLFMNKKHISRMGFSGHEYLEKPYAEFHSDEETKSFVEKITEIFESGKSVRYEHKSVRDGRYFLLTLSPVKKADGIVTAVTVISKDINDMKELQEQLRTLSLTDELTGIYNRRGLFTLGEQLLKLSKRENKGIFMLYVDVDNLKEINDTWGHDEGDRMLKETADILKKSYRDSDVTARVGGDEFVVIPIGIEGDNIERIIGRLRSNIDAHNKMRKSDCTLSVSIGVTYYDPKDPCSISELLSRADKMMYLQKRNKLK